MKRIKASIQGFLKYKCLLKELVGRDFKLKYRRSFLGYAWSLLNPLCTMLVMTAIFSNFFRFSIENYPIYFLLGQLMFGFFSESTSSALTSVFDNAELMRKVYVPKYLFPVAKVSFSFVNMLCSLGAVAIVMIIERVWVSKTIILLPVLFFYAYGISLGVGLILASVAVYFRDLIHLYSVFLTAIMYLTAIFYPVEILPNWVFKMIQFNPVYHLVVYFREIVLYGTWPTLQQNVVCIAFAGFFMITGLVVFKKNQKNFMLYV